MQQVTNRLKRLSPKSMVAVAALLVLVGGLSYVGVLAFNTSIGMHSWLTAQQIWKGERKQLVGCVRDTIEQSDPTAMRSCESTDELYGAHAKLRHFVNAKDWEAARPHAIRVGLTRSETDAALDLFKYGHAIPQTAAAMEVWGEAIVAVRELLELGEQAERLLELGQVDEARRDELLHRLDLLDERLVKAEERFGALLHQASPWGRYIGAASILAALFLLAASGAYLGRLAQLFQEEHAVVQHRLARQEAKMMEADRMIAVGTLAAGVGHEINNPLTYVAGGIDFAQRTLRGLIERDEPKIDEESMRRELLEALDALDDAREGTDRVRDIARDLRTFARHEETREIAPVDLVPIIELAVDMAHHEIRHRASVARDYADHSVALGNESRLAQVFLNLVVNAAQAIEVGAAADNEIKLVTRREGDEIVVEVSDTGKGIHADERDIVFEPFRTTKPEGEGTGLGMAISRNIVESLGGTIDFVSEPGVRTVFTVRLPAADT
ncbi:HAMP domain-containing histidine kinase [Persicimonas caeni]|uniref:histidine kinase n=1 Tax=Persicimonas caeni TaxID=2292766 RepID=A0A4Y6PWH4_PERCE|nr:ATP-binding protein [Persicimonas caeni]QDG52367.1 HAMP domain-containing histidine kinase [Persicimonas caeni]QED33589.1 HAMP domain-containing histidine kinase [Persicimonas caeni]